MILANALESPPRHNTIQQYTKHLRPEQTIGKLEHLNSENTPRAGNKLYRTINRHFVISGYLYYSSQSLRLLRELKDLNPVRLHHSAKM